MLLPFFFLFIIIEEVMQRYMVVVAGGSGKRMGSDIPKQFLPINGKPILMRTIERIYQYSSDISIILVLPENQMDYWQLLCQEITHISPPATIPKISLHHHHPFAHDETETI